MEIELPDGTILDAPDDADPSAVAKNYLRKRSVATTRDAARSVYDDMSTGERLAVGFARPFVELGLGAKDLAGKVGIGSGLNDEDRANLERLQEVSGGAGTAGRIVGEVASFALPGGAATKLASKAARFPRAAALAADMVTSAGVEALKAPTEGESRLGRAVEGAVGAGVGRAIGAGARAALTGARPASTQAAALAAQGVPLTPGMARGGMLQKLEERIADVPFSGKQLQQRQADAIRAWNRNVLNRTVPEGEVTTAGHEGFTQAREAFRSAYDKLWNQDIPVDVAAVGKSWDTALASAPPDVAAAAGGKLRELMQGTLDGNLTDTGVAGSAISRIDDELRKLSTLAARRGEADLAAVYARARDSMRSALPEKVSTELSRIDGKYREFAVARRAGGYKTTAENGGVFTPSQLLQASVAADRSKGKAAVAEGRAVLQKDATDALSVLGKRPARENELVSLALILPTLPAKALYSAPVQKLQRGAAPRWDRIARLLRERGVTAGTLGAATEE